MPDEVLMNDDIHGRCISDKIFPRIAVSRCDFTIEKHQRTFKEGGNKIYCTDFVIRNVTATCEYMCVSTKIEKKIVVVKGMDVYTHVYMYVDTCLYYRCNDITYTSQHNYL